MSQKKILYVDDEPTNRILFEIHFRKVVTVLLADNGAHGLEIMKSNEDIIAVFTDYKMPVMNGLDFILYAKEIIPAIPYFIVSGLFPTPELIKAKEKAVYKQYFIKPYKVNEIIKAIEKHSA